MYYFQTARRLVILHTLDETDILQTAEPGAQGGQLTENLIKVACSKRAIGSLVLALQHSSNEDILAETYEWLATLSSARKRNHRMTMTSLVNKRSKEETPKTLKSIIFKQAAHQHELSKLVLKCLQKSAIKGTIGVQFDKRRMMACSADGTIDLWNWWDKEKDSIKIAANVKNITCFQYDEQILVLGTTDGTVHLFDTRKFEEKSSINLNDKMVRCLKDQEVSLLKFVQSTVMVLTRRDGYERLWSIDISRRNMRLLNPRSLFWWGTIKNQTPDVCMWPDMSFVTYGTVVLVYHTKSGKQMTDSPEFPVSAPGVISTLHLGDLYSTKRVLMTGCVNGKICVWHTSQGTWVNPFRTFQGHTEAVVSLCSLNGHLLSLDQSGKLLIWFGHNLDNKSVTPAPRVVLEGSNMTSLTAHQPWFASCSSKDDMINIWTMPDSWLRIY